MKGLLTSLSKVWTTCYSDGELRCIEIQVLVRTGLPRFDIIGLPQNMIREGKDRIQSSLCHLGVDLSTYKILVSLNPADKPKEGSHFDLPILAGILEALGILPFLPQRTFLWGELALDGSVRPFEWIVPHGLFASRFGSVELRSELSDQTYLSFLRSIFGCTFKQVSHIKDLISNSAPTDSKRGIREIIEENLFCSQVELTESARNHWLSQDTTGSRWNSFKGRPDQFLFWVLIALGRHHAFVQGPPGVGKSSWCYALDELQIPLASHHWHEKFKHIPSKFRPGDRNILSLGRRPFEAPHHSSTMQSIVGGGVSFLEPGAITRAHMGILFLDEFCEFARSVIESLREPLETRQVSLARRGCSKQFPADIQLLAAMNPCRCGRYRSNSKCQCSTKQFHDYQSKISGPIHDRFHVHAWWEFHEFERPSEFELSFIRRKFLECKDGSRIQFHQIDFPRSSSPRKFQRQLEIFRSWCRWHQIDLPSQNNWNECLEFFRNMEMTGVEYEQEVQMRELWGDATGN